VWNRYATYLNTHPMAAGFLRLKGRRERRPTFQREGVFRYAWRRVRELNDFARVLVRLFFEFEEIWLLTRKKDDPRWATLAELRATWALVQDRIATSDMAGRCDDALQELHKYLEAASIRLHQTCSEGVIASGRIKRKLEKKAREVDDYVKSLDLQMPSWRRVVQTEQYVRENLLGGYEELAIRYVAQRRWFNAYRAELANRFRTGRFLTANISPLPRLLVFEAILGLRFSLAFYSKMV